MSTIAAGTTSTTGLVQSSDTTGNLVFQTNGTTTALTLGTNQNATFAGGITVAGAATFTTALAGSTGASRVLIQRQTPSAAATCDFTTGIDSTYDEYLFVFNNMIPATNGQYLRIRFSEDSGSSFKSGATDYNYAFASVRDDALALPTGSTGDSSIAVTYSTSNTVADGGGNGEVRLFNPAGTSAKKVVTMLSGGQYNSGFVSLAGSGRFQLDNNAINGVRFFYPSGNITSGTISLYGIKKS